MQAYLDTIKAKTAKTVANFRDLATKKRFVKRSDLMDWLKTKFELGHGHSNAMKHQILNIEVDTSTTEENIARMFQGTKAVWRKPCLSRL